MNRNPHMICRLLVLYALAAILPASARAEDLPPAAYEKAKAAAVEILVNGHLNGSGWIADAKGLVITAGHVVEQPDRRFEVRVPGVGRTDARLLAVDLGHDLAMMSIEPRKGGYPCLKLADKWPAPGTAVYVIGAPLYRHGLLAPGAVAGSETAFEYYADRFNEVMHVAATVPRGMSGGPWIDAAGEVVGVQSGVMSQSGVPIGIAFSCPLPAMRGLLERKHSAATPALGLIVEELLVAGPQDAGPLRAEGRGPDHQDGASRRTRRACGRKGDGPDRRRRRQADSSHVRPDAHGLRAAAGPIAGVDLAAARRRGPDQGNGPPRQAGNGVAVSKRTVCFRE